MEPNGRPVGGTENSWCRAASCGTGTVVLALHLTIEPNTRLLQNALQKLQNAYPVLRSKLHYDTSTGFSFLTPSSPYIQIQTFSLLDTSKLLSKSSTDPLLLSPLHTIFEHELNINAWSDPTRYPRTGVDMFFASLYELPEKRWVVVLRLHAAVCDRTTAVSLLKLLKDLVGGKSGETIGKKEEVNLGIENLVPPGKFKKGLWAHGLDMLSYSVNSLRLTNLKFLDVKRPRWSEVVRLQMTLQDTTKIIAGCKRAGLNLCGALTASALMATHSYNYRDNAEQNQKKKKYGVVTLTDCRSILHPPLSNHDMGFYHSAILNILSVKGGENLWELATRSYTAFQNSKKAGKHFSDMADLNFLMCKAMENPSLTASSSLRSSVITVFEDVVMEDRTQQEQELGLEDYLGCPSIHGIGSSIAFFDTIRDGKLDCACVYPSPLHSREQIQELVDHIKKILIASTN